MSELKYISNTFFEIDPEAKQVNCKVKLYIMIVINYLKKIPSRNPAADPYVFTHGTYTAATSCGKRMTNTRSEHKEKSL